MTTPDASARGQLVAVGDSFSCGVGVGVQIPAAQTWVGLLAAALDLELEMLAAPGLASAEVLRGSVPVATARRGEVATLLVGLNDILRAAFVPEQTCANLHEIIGELCAAYPVVLVARLHDAVALLPLPSALRRRYLRRIATVNLALDHAAAAQERAVLFDLAAVPALAGRCAWAADRIHPSRYGHHVVAEAALTALRNGGAAAARGARLRIAALPEPPPSLLDEVRWFLGFGGPWLARRLPKLVLAGSTKAKLVDRCRRVGRGSGEPLRDRDVPRGEQVVHR